MDANALALMGAYLFITLLCIAALILFFSLKRDLAAIGVRCDASAGDAIAAGQQLKTELAGLRGELEECEKRTGLLAPPAPRASGMNLTSRTQVIRMSRRGDSAESIAAMLRVPRNEVELLLRVQALTAARTASAPPAA